MNERINQILSQAYDEAVPETWTELSSIQLGRIYDKFAELLIQECIDAVENSNDRYRKEYFAGKIRERFGIDQ